MKGYIRTAVVLACICAVFLIRIIASRGTRILIPKKPTIDFFTSKKSFFTRLAIIVATSNVCQHNILNGCLFKQHIRQFFLHFRHVICNSGEAKG